MLLVDRPGPLKKKNGKAKTLDERTAQSVTSCRRGPPDGLTNSNHSCDMADLPARNCALRRDTHALNQARSGRACASKFPSEPALARLAWTRECWVSQPRAASVLPAAGPNDANAMQMCCSFVRQPSLQPPHRQIWEGHLNLAVGP